MERFSITSHRDRIFDTLVPKVNKNDRNAQQTLDRLADNIALMMWLTGYKNIGSHAEAMGLIKQQKNSSLKLCMI